MAKPSPDIKILACDNFSEGLNTLDDATNLALGESPEMLNVNVNQQGAVVCRYGYELVSTIAGATGAMRGMLPFYRTYNDNNSIDQSADQGHAYANTYTVPITPVSEGATNKLTFTPTQSTVLSIAVYVVSKGSSSWDLTLHDASNNIIGTSTKQNSELVNSAFNYFYINYTVTSPGSPLHFHLTSPVADGTVKTNVAGDLSTASFIETYSTIGDYLLLFHSNGNVYVVTNDNFTPTLLGSYGTDNGMVRGGVFNNMAFFGNGLVSNAVKKWDAIALADLGGNPPDASFFSVFAKRIFASGSVASPSTINYTDTDTSETWKTSTNFLNIDKGDGTVCTGFSPNNNFLEVFKERTLHGVNFQYDNSFNVSVPLVQPIINGSSGCIANGSIQPVYAYSYYLSRNGVEVYGPSDTFQDTNLPISLKINPTINQLNKTYLNNVNSAFFDQKYLLTAPFQNSVTNNYTLVYNESTKRRFGVNSWSVWNDIPALQYATFRDSNKNDQLYFVSTTEPNLYRTTTNFSDNGFGYTRSWKSKTFQFGERTRWWWLDIDGYITQGATVYVDVEVDNVVQTYEITSANLVNPSLSGGYIGGGSVGSSYIGGGFLSDSSIPLYEFRRRCMFGGTIDFGYQMKFTIRNQEDSQGWALTRYRIAYEQQPEDPSYARVYA